MQLRQLVSAVCKREGKKHQASVGDVREIIKIMIEVNADSMGRTDEDGAVETLIYLESLKVLNSRNKKK